MKLNLKTKKSDSKSKKTKDEEVKVKKSKKSGAPEAKKSKGSDALAKARAARASGKTKKSDSKSKKPKALTWAAPETLGSSFPIEVSFRTEKDGMPGGKWRIIRIKGRYPTEDENKMFDLSVIDPETFTALVSRMSLTLFHPTGRLSSKGVSPRLKPKTQYRALIRCSRRKKDDTIYCRVATVWIIEKDKKGKVQAIELDKKDPDARRIKKINKHLPAAFLRLADLPAKKSRRAKDEDDDE